jgi:hypothetical protein
MVAEAEQFEPILDGVTYNSFINAIKSPATRTGYINFLTRYMNHLKITKPDDLLLNQQNPPDNWIPENRLYYVTTKWQPSLCNNQVSNYSYLYILSVKWCHTKQKEVSRYLGEYKRKVKDEAYSNEMILQGLQNADHRMRMIVLILASTGARLGSLSDLTLGNLTKLPYSFLRLSAQSGKLQETQSPHDYKWLSLGPACKYTTTAIRLWPPLNRVDIIFSDS